jgi:hypothetical protein
LFDGVLFQHKKVWVSCEAEDASQAQDLGTVQYFPEEGFNVKYFPYTNLPGYMSPLVAVHFASPKRKSLHDFVPSNMKGRKYKRLENKIKVNKATRFNYLACLIKIHVFFNKIECTVARLLLKLCIMQQGL